MHLMSFIRNNRRAGALATDNNPAGTRALALTGEHQMKMKYFTSVAFAALMLPAAAHAQSTGTIEAEGAGEDIVVTGSRGPTTISGVQIPDSPKARG